MSLSDAKREKYSSSPVLQLQCIILQMQRLVIGGPQTPLRYLTQ